VVISILYISCDKLLLWFVEPVERLAFTSSMVFARVSAFILMLLLIIGTCPCGSENAFLALLIQSKQAVHFPIQLRKAALELLSNSVVIVIIIVGFFIFSSHGKDYMIKRLIKS